MHLSDDPNELLLQVSLANQQALKKLYNVTAAKLFAISLRITKQEALSEEVLQDCFLKVWENAHRFDPDKAQAITWLGTMVRNRSIDVIRQQSKHHGHDDIDDTPIEDSQQATPEQLAIAQSHGQSLTICLQQLNTQQKNIFLMAYLDGHTQQQIADMQSIPVGTVKTWLYRSTEKIRDCLNHVMKGML